MYLSELSLDRKNSLKILNEIDGLFYLFLDFEALKIRKTEFSLGWI